MNLVTSLPFKRKKKRNTNQLGVCVVPVMMKLGPLLVIIIRALFCALKTHSMFHVVNFHYYMLFSFV